MEAQAQAYTLTDIRYVASQIAADLKRLQLVMWQGVPSNEDITAYRAEVTQLLHDGYLATAAYGWRRNGHWAWGLRYEADVIGNVAEGDSEGRRSTHELAGGRFLSYLTYSEKWEMELLSEADKLKYQQEHLPFIRHDGKEPGGEWYSAGKYRSNGIYISRHRVKWR